ncbi:MAG: hypothetical protein ACI3VB_00030 [Oscillospiraceae bacterium]
MFKKMFNAVKDRDIELLRKEYSAGDYIENRDYINYLISNH